MRPEFDTAIIGAGMAGLACARRLRDAGETVAILDKGRGPGGRMSTRRDGDLTFDHGAQFFTARDAGFQSLVRDLEKHGAAARWEARFARLSEDGIEAAPPGEARWVGTPGMNAVIRALAEGLNVTFGARVNGLERTAQGWRIAAPERDVTARRAVLAAPADQVVALSPDGALSRFAKEARYAPCLTAMLVFDQLAECDFDALEIESGLLAWLARNSAKPGRPDAETWVAHAAPDWSRAHLEDSPEDFAPRLAAEAARILNVPAPARVSGHRWRYALVEQAAPAPFFHDADIGLAACGDWCLAPRIEAAWQSGDRLGAAMTEAR